MKWLIRSFKQTFIISRRLTNGSYQVHSATYTDYREAMRVAKNLNGSSRKRPTILQRINHYSGG